MTNPQAAPQVDQPDDVGLDLTLDKDLGPVLETVLEQLDRYAGTSPAQQVLDVEQAGLDRRLAANQALLARLARMSQLRQQYRGAFADRALVTAEIANLELDLAEAKKKKDNAAQQTELEHKLTAARERAADLDATMAKARADYRGDDASGLDRDERLTRLRQQHQAASDELSRIDAQLQGLETRRNNATNDTDRASIQQQIDETLVKQSSLRRNKAQYEADYQRERATDVDQSVMDSWSPHDPAWGIDNFGAEPAAFATMTAALTGTLNDLQSRREDIVSQLAVEQGDKAAAKRTAVADALKAVRDEADPETRKKREERKAAADQEAERAKQKATELALSLDADITAARDRIQAEYDKKKTADGTLPPVQLRQMTNRQAKAEDKLIAAAVKAGQEAEKKARAAIDANPDLILVSRLDALRRVLPREAYDYDTLDSLSVATRLAAMEKSTEKVLGGLMTNLDQLKKPGSKIERGIDLEAGVALETLSVARLRLTALYGLRVAIEHGDDGKFKARLTNSLGAKLGAKLGFDADQVTGIALASARGDVAWGQERVYNSLPDLLTAERNLVLEAVLASTGTKGKASKQDRTFLRRRAELIAQAHVNEAAFNERLRRLGVEKKVKSYSPRHVDVVTTKKSSQTHAVEAKAVFQVVDPLAPNPVGLSAGGGLALKQGLVSKQAFKSFSFISEISDNAALQELHMLKDDKGLTRVNIEREVVDNPDTKPTSRTTRSVMSHDGTVKYYRDLDSRITSLKAARTADAGSDAVDPPLLGIAKNLRTELELLRAEYDTFTDLSRSVTGDASNAARETQREQLMKSRGMTKDDNAAYIRSLSLQYAVLRRLCESANEPFAGTGDDVLPPAKRQHLDAFQDDLQTPRIALSDKEVRRVFGDDAVADPEVLVTTDLVVNAAVAGTLGGSSTGGSMPGADTTKGKAKAPTLNLSIAYQAETKHKRGVKDPDTALSIVVDGNFSLSGSASETDTMGTESPADDKKLLTNMVGKLLDVRSLKKLGVEKDPALEASVADALKATMTRGNGTIKIDFKTVNGTLRLRRVTSLQQAKRNLGGGASIPTGSPLNVVVGLNVSQNKTTVLNVYYGSNTLSELTNLYRTEADPEQAGGGQRWRQVKGDSQLLQRMIKQMEGTWRFTDAEQQGRGVQQAHSFEDVLRGIKNGTVMKGTDLLKAMPDEHGSVAGVGNEMVSWLLDLKTSSQNEDRAAADAFIDAWSANLTALRTKQEGSDDYTAAMAAVEEQFEQVIKRKTALEDTKTDDPFVKRRGFSRGFLNEFIATKLQAESGLLIERLQAAEADMSSTGDSEMLPGSVDALRKRALRLYKANKTRKNLELLEDVMALDYASKTLDDLTKFDDEKDKDEAIGMLGADLDKLLRGHRKNRQVDSSAAADDDEQVPKAKVYVNALIEAELSARDTGDLELLPVVKKGKAPIVKKNMLDREIDLVSQKINTDAGGDIAYRANKVKMISDHHGNPTIEWTDKYYNPKSRAEYFHKQKAKKGVLFYSRTAAKKDLRTHGDKSISAQLRKLMEAQARKQQQRRLQAQQAKRKAAQAAHH